MNSRPHRSGAPGAHRPSAALMHRAPQSAAHAAPPAHAPNAALLIDFDNVTMGIQKDLHTELRKLLSSEIIRGKVAVQRAYADWRRYPQYIVPLAESSIDMIMAPAYGSSKKNATDIRLAIDALELVFTRPEIGTFILLSGDSDFSSLVIKLKEYGKYVIGVGIRESSSDLLVMNCDEYYSWNALTGLVKTDEDEPSRKYDPWELVTEAVQRMKRNGDVMRSDRLKQVMQEIDASFDEKEYGYSKFSRFCQEAAGKGLLSVSKLENGQLEVDVPGTSPATVTTTVTGEAPRAERPERDEEGEERGGRRGRRGRGRGRDRDRGERGERGERAEREDRQGELRLSGAAATAPAPSAAPAAPAAAPAGPAIGVSGERLTRDEAFDLVRRAAAAATIGGQAARAGDVRTRARDLLGRDSESLSERNFSRILRDAHDAEVIDLRRRGDDFEVAPAAEAAPAAEQPAPVEAAAPAAPAAPAMPRVGMGTRGIAPRGRGRPGAPLPPELLSIGIVPATPAPAPAPAPRAAEPAAAAEATEGGRPAAKKGGRGRGGAAKKAPAKKAVAKAPAAKAPAAEAPAAKGKRGKPAAKKAPARAAKKSARNAE